MTAKDWTGRDAGRTLRWPTAHDDKYSRGVVGLRTGSTRYAGAAMLGVEAAWRTGTGMVRYLGPERAQNLVLQRRPETVTADGRVQAWVMGSGTDAAERAAAETAALRGILRADVPVVVDAGALDLVAGAAAPVIVTPHARELDRLRESLGLEASDPRDDDAREAAARETAEAIGAVVLLKGAVTIVAAAGGWTRRVTTGTPWLATAGTGDVLAGVLGAVTAGSVAADRTSLDDLAACAATAAWLHGTAGTRASQAYGGLGGPITALDIAGELPSVVAGLQADSIG
ncbi:NAD(P)H-hydrate dehydratase [Microbacterium sp. CFBP 8790]|uniref:ADP-dependent NAD(P)H-hydrate dehydratase n=1 Tax=unclassified Microbacterium TaxID=2609290 RepID=UPI00177E1C06|nr:MULTISPECIES: ADP/ATP-dependent (S)-NAD(P)H-hydrate dehydratase [unclassified Microbacterium]MBD8205478.1 NAD(P)H-hydrate dehydratase [Microbacterium sp. CFBP 8801]MBD8508187.1 NAD(P)H-hydrate dehydratase [Microbacterium sp. CFBP 8790]